MGGPTINDHFPISDSLSPPRISNPVYECAEAVHLTGFVPHAIVRVYAGGGEQIAEEEPPFGFADVPLWRRVGKDERLTATQIVLGKESGQSSPDVIVEALPASAITTTRPVVGKTLYECGRVVPVSNLVPSTRVHVTENAVEVGVEPTATPNHPVVTTPLHKDGQVTAQQLGCEGTDHQITGLVSDPPVTVKPAPDPVPAPAFDEPSLIPGNDVATLTKLLIGATVRVTRGGAVIGDGLATAESNWIPLNAKLDGSAIQATQELCGKVSPPSRRLPRES